MMTTVPWVVLLSAAAAVLLLRRYRERIPGVAWHVVGLLPLVLVFFAALAVVLAFPGLAGFKVKNFGDMPGASASLLALLPALAWGRGRAIVAGVTLFAMALITWGDLLFWRQFDTLLPLASAGSGGQLWDVRDSIASLVEPGDAVLLPVGIAGTVLAIFWPGRPRSAPRPELSRLAEGIVTGAIVVAASVGLTLGAQPVFSDVSAWMRERHSWKVFSWSETLTRVGHVAAHARDMARTAREVLETESLTDEQWRRIVQLARERRGAALPDGFGVAKGRNVLVLQLEGMQSWVVGTTVDDEPITPFLNGLRERALYFSNIWDQTGGSPTSDCEYLVLNSQHPLPVGSVAFRRADNAFVALPATLRDNGYRTFAAHAYRPGMWNRGLLYPRYGFSESAFADDLGPGPKIGWGLSDKEFYRRIPERLRKLKEPWFAFTISLSSHHPYNYLPRKERRIALGPLAGTQLAGYIASMRYVDEAVAQLFGALERSGLLDRTLVVIYGDHDSKLKLKRSEARRARDALSLDEKTVGFIAQRDWVTKKIPLFFVFPKKARVGIVERVGGQIDIGATILHYVGVSVPGSFFGRPLVGNGGGMTAQFAGSAAGEDILWRPNASGGDCLDGAGIPRPKDACGDLRKKAGEEVELSLLVTTHDLAERLSETVSGVRRSAEVLR